MTVSCVDWAAKSSSEGWQLCSGMGGSFRVEWVAGLLWNQWQVSSGIRKYRGAIMFCSILFSILAFRLEFSYARETAIFGISAANFIYAIQFGIVTSILPIFIWIVSALLVNLIIKTCSGSNPESIIENFYIR